MPSWICLSEYAARRPSEQQVLRPQFRDMVHTVPIPVIGQGTAGRYGDRVRLLAASPDGQDAEQVQLRRNAEPSGYGLLVERPDDQTAEPHADRLQKHALQGYSQVDEEILILLDGACDQNESLRFRARERQMELRQSGSHHYVPEDQFRLRTSCHGTESQSLPVPCRRNSGVDGDDSPELLPVDRAILSESPDAPVPGKQGVD